MSEQDSHASTMIRSTGAPATGMLAGRTALVTGASSGIGRAIAIRLAEQGAAVALVGRDQHRLFAVAANVRRHGALANPIVADLTSADSIERISEDIACRGPGLDLLVHSAGAYHRAPTDEAPMTQLDALYEANLRAPYALTQSLLPALRHAHGDVVFINSTQGMAAGPELSQFAATQHALRALADSLRAEVNYTGVRVTTLHVGRTATPRQERIFKLDNRPYIPERLIHPDDIADLVIAAVTLPRRTQLTNLTIWPTIPS